MPYSELLVRPMREELTSAGVKELRTPQEVDAFMNDKTGTAMLVVNSVCGCAAGMARPGVRLALQGRQLIEAEFDVHRNAARLRKLWPLRN